MVAVTGSSFAAIADSMGKRGGPGHKRFVVTACTLDGEKWECRGCRRTTLIETVLERIAFRMGAEVGSLWLFLGNEQLDPESTLHDAKVGRDTCLTIMRKPYEDSTSDDDLPSLVDSSSEEPPRCLREVREESDSDDSESFLRGLERIHGAVHAAP